MKKSSESARVELLDFAPKFGKSGPDDIMAASGILTMKNKEFSKTLGKIDEKFLEGFHNEATRRGHASLTTSSNYYFWMEGSRMIDFYFSSFPFASCLVFSSRRIKIEPENLIAPDAIADSEFSDEYKQVAESMVSLYHRVNEKTGRMDYARRILPIGFVSKMFLDIPLQTMLGIIKETKVDSKRLLPEEIHRVAAVFEKTIREKTPYLADASLRLKYNTNFSHPNVFSGTGEYGKEGSRIILKDDRLLEHMEKARSMLYSLSNDPSERPEQASSAWKEFVENVQDEIIVKSKVNCSLSVWNDIKRHRTMRQNVESLYSAADRCASSWDASSLYIPQTGDAELDAEVESVYKKAFILYRKMVDSGIEKRDAAYIIPHGIKLGVGMVMDGYHLFDPFGFVGIRTCTTTDHEIVGMLNRIIAELDKELPGIGQLIGPKCKVGYCPEKEFCNVVKKFDREYDQEKHEKYSQ